jgi:hypothetical protein
LNLHAVCGIRELTRRDMRRTDPEPLAAYYAARYRALRRTAYLLSGDWHEGPRT